MRKSRLSERCFIGVVVAVFLRRRRLVCRFTEINVRRGGVRFGICAVFMPAVFGVRLLAAVGYREYNDIFKGWR